MSERNVGDNIQRHPKGEIALKGGRGKPFRTRCYVTAALARRNSPRKRDRAGDAWSADRCKEAWAQNGSGDLSGADIRKRLGRSVRRLRTERGLSREKFAFSVLIHSTYVSDIEHGSRNPTILIVEKLAKALSVKAKQLLE